MPILKAVVTGGAGFIGSSLSEKLAREGWEVTVFDNLVTGSKSNLSWLSEVPPFRGSTLVEGDCTVASDIEKAVRDCDAVLHFAASSAVRIALNDPAECFRQNILGTYNVLEAFRQSEADVIVFASTSTVYGEPALLPTPEGYSPLEPISTYGVSKLAGEALVTLYCHTFGKRGVILRLANVVGPKSKYGVVSDFVSKLKRKSDELSIIGDGTQNKSYIYIDDCVQAALAAMNQSRNSVGIFNVGSEDSISVKEVGLIVARSMGLNDPTLLFDGGLPDGRGWLGDVKTMRLDITKLKSIGWRPRLSSREAIEQTVRDLAPILPNNIRVS